LLDQLIEIGNLSEWGKIAGKDKPLLSKGSAQVVQELAAKDPAQYFYRPVLRNEYEDDAAGFVPMYVGHPETRCPLPSALDRPQLPATFRRRRGTAFHT
jgi:hypothetical protein